MPSFIPRYDDCEPGGRLHPASYLRAMLQAAIEAGAANDPGVSVKDPPGWLAHVGDLGVRIEQPIMFGDAIEVETRLARQDTQSWRRECVFKRAGATVARGFVDCFADEEDQQSEGESDNDTTPEPADQEPPAWDGPVPDPPEAPGRAFKGVWHVAWQHLDISGQLDPAELTTMVGDMEARADESLSWTPAREYENGITWQVSEHRLELFDVIEDEDDLHIVSYIGEVDEAEMVRHTSIWRDDSGVPSEVARTRTRWVCIDPSTGERGNIPDVWVDDMFDQLAEW